MPKQNVGSRVSFGTFELDLRAGELRREGFKVKLQEQPLQVLAFLLERPGEVVTRDELRARIWTSGLFVDFDQGLNKAINKVRDALGDSAENPRFVETVARRGYRFLAPVSLPSASNQTADHAPPRGHPLARHRILTAAGLATLGAILALSFAPIASVPKLARMVQLTNDGAIKAGLVTDGPRLYFLAWVSGKHVIAQVSATGGETYLLRDPLPAGDWGFDQLLDISPDKQELLLVREGPGGDGCRLWLYRILDGSIQQLGNIAADDARWSRDGRTLSYIRGGEAFVAKADGTGTTKVEIGGLARRVLSSPDAGRVRFCVEQNTSDAAIWEVEASRLAIRRIGPQWPCTDGAWSPKSDSFLFPQQGALWAVAKRFYLSPGNSGRGIQLTRGAPRFSSPVYSPNAHKAFAIGDLPRGETVRYEPNSRSFVPYLGGIAADGAAFTPDEQWIAYTSYPGRDLWRMKADGRDRLQITSGIEAYSPRWSPDARRIVFMCRSPGKSSSVCLISAEGGALEKLTGSIDEESEPDWSPDGASIAFTTESRGIIVADVNTRRLVQLPLSKGKRSARWSPVGRRLVAVERGKLVLFDFEAAEWTELTSEGWATSPSWSSDGWSIYIVRMHSNGGDIARVDARSGRQQAVASLIGMHIAGRLGLTPKNEPVVLRDAGSHEVYALDLEE